MDRNSEEPKTEQTPCESGNDRSDGVENAMEKKKRRLEQMMLERGEVEDGFERRRLEEEQFLERRRLEEERFYERMRVEKEQSIDRRDELNREIAEVRESLLEDGEGMTFELLPDDILYRIFSFLPFEDRMKARVSRRMVEMERKAGTSEKLKEFFLLEITFGEAHSSPFRLMLENPKLKWTWSLDSFDSALNVLRFIGQTIIVSEEIIIEKFCHLADSDRVLLLEMITRFKGAIEIFIQCGKHAEYFCDSKKNAGPLSFSLLRPMLEREWKIVINCPVEAAIKDLNFIHEKVMSTGQFVFLRVIGDVGEGYKNHLKETVEPTDKVFTGMNFEWGIRRPVLMRVRQSGQSGHDEKVFNVEDEFDLDEKEDETDEKEDHMLVSVIQNEVKRGKVPTLDIEFILTTRRSVGYKTMGLVETTRND